MPEKEKGKVIEKEPVKREEKSVKEKKNLVKEEKEKEKEKVADLSNTETGPTEPKIPIGVITRRIEELSTEYSNLLGQKKRLEDRMLQVEGIVSEFRKLEVKVI